MEECRSGGFGHPNGLLEGPSRRSRITRGSKTIRRLIFLAIWAAAVTTGSCGHVRTRTCPIVDGARLNGTAEKALGPRREHAGAMEAKFRIDSTGHPQNKTEDFALEILTMNVTSWGAAKEFLLKTTANLICMQEHKLWGEKLEEAARWTEAQGWTVIWGPAKANEEESGSSGGVAILARIGIGLVNSNANTNLENRLVGAWVEAPGYDRFLIHSAYFCVRAGLSGTNAEVM